jgi:hypothetical protein
VKNVTLYDPAKYSHELENTPWLDITNSYGENIQSIYAIDQIIQFKSLTKDDQIQIFLVHLDPL